VEPLWRKDGVYDIIVVIGYNDKPVKKSKGSAIFLHVAKDGFKDTEGCIALKLGDLLKIITSVTPPSHITVLSPQTD
jgi:L,D-peptidoglycan transpeptidase YkuD (ErfK/YbiS/YcfS/YnhG family)